MDMQASKTELTAGHPDTGVYSSDDVTAADQLNAPNRQPDKTILNAGDLVASIVQSDYDALSANGKRVFEAYRFSPNSTRYTNTEVSVGRDVPSRKHNAY